MNDPRTDLLQYDSITQQRVLSSIHLDTSDEPASLVEQFKVNVVNFLTEGVTEEDKKVMDSICEGYTDMVAKATDAEMLEVLNPKL